MGSPEVISHWHHSVDNFSTSSLEFYRGVEDTLTSKQAPTRVDHIDWKEGGVLSARREYLRISYGRFSFDLCAAPFGKDFFFSWWLVRRGAQGALMYGCLGLLAVPVIYLILAKIFGAVLGILILLGLAFASLFASTNARGEIGILVEDALLGLPIIGFLYGRFVRPVTYYTEDSRLIFEESVHQIVVDHIKALLSAHGVRELAPDETKPTSRSVLR